MELPSQEEREAIWRIHLAKVGQAELAGDADAVRAMAAASEGFSGAEIEQTVHDAMYETYEPGKPLALGRADVLSAMDGMVPLSKARHRELRVLNAWAASNARHASVPRRKFAESQASSAAIRPTEYDADANSQVLM